MAVEALDTTPELTALHQLPPTTSEILPPVSRKEAARRLGRLQLAVERYDPSAPEASHLRAHQGEAIANFCQAVGALTLSEFMEGTGLAVLLPTGSGKTVSMAEMMRLLHADHDGGEPIRSLGLVPRRQLREQTVGSSEDEKGIQAFAPELTVVSMAGRQRSFKFDIGVMTYHTLGPAVKRGDFEKFNPDILFCDEAHHVIDGVWAQYVSQMRRGRLLVGLTATPAYSEFKNTDRLFPRIVIHKTIRNGIEGGFLSDFQGFMYRGSSRIKTRKMAGDFDEEGLFRSIAESEDNYLVAKICAAEVEQGRRGVVGCVPGYNRAHAKIIADILRQMPVKTAEGKRTIRAEHVDGDIKPDRLRQILDDYKNGKIDVLTYVDMLLEGWDSPETDFQVLARPTLSRLLAEQRLGRILRPREDKIATVHEIMYDIDEDGEQRSQVTYLDVIDEVDIRQGRSIRSRWQSDPERPTAATSSSKKSSPGKTVPSSGFSTIPSVVLDKELLGRISQLDNTPLSEIRVSCGQAPIPYEWQSSYTLAVKFNTTIEEIDAALEGRVPSRKQAYVSAEHTFYPERAIGVLAKDLKLKPMPEGYVPLSVVVERVRQRRNAAHASRFAIRRMLEEDGIKPKPFVDGDGNVVLGYKVSEVHISSAAPSLKSPAAPQKPPEAKKPKLDYDSPDVQEAVAIQNWLAEVLIDPATVTDRIRNRYVRQAQNTIGAILRSPRRVVIPAELRAAVQAANGLPKKSRPRGVTWQMEKLMEANGMTLTDLVMVGLQAKKLFDHVNKSSEEAY